MSILNRIKNKFSLNYRKKRWPGLINAYKQYLPVTSKTPIVSLNEGNTPLIFSKSISKLIGNDTKVYLKYDGLNPTGSFKDRGMTMAISKAKEQGREAVICASTGNTSAAAAAYASRGGLKSYVLIPEGFVAQGKLAQALMYGAEIISIDGNFDRALEIVRELSSEYPIELVNSVNPYRIQGQKTAAFEIVDDLKISPDWLCIPMGNAGNITAYWLGFKEYSKVKRNIKLPKILVIKSKTAAKKIFNRFTEIYPENSFPKPKVVLDTDINIMRKTGLSNNKSHYIKNIAKAFVEDSDIYYNLSEMYDDDIIDALTKVKGIGIWTAQMFLMFTLNRSDIFPVTDLAMQKGYKAYFKLADLPKPKEMLSRSEIWKPYRTTVSLYLWAILEGPFEW